MKKENRALTENLMASSTSCFLHHHALSIPSRKQSRNITPRVKPAQVVCRAQKQVKEDAGEVGPAVSRRALSALVGAAAIGSGVSPAPASADSKLAGGYTPIENIQNPHIQELGEFAVTEYNKQEKSNLKFDRVTRGEVQVVAGINYRLYISAAPKEGGLLRTYLAEVYEKPWEGVKELTFFVPFSR